MDPKVMNDALRTGSLVVAELKFSKGDLYLIETKHTCSDAEDAQVWLRERGITEGAGGAWPDWSEYHILRVKEGRYFDLQGFPVVPII